MSGHERSPEDARAAENDAACDHPGLDHDAQWSYCWTCPACGVCKFIGHGPLCGDCYGKRVAPPVKRA